MTALYTLTVIFFILNFPVKTSVFVGMDCGALKLKGRIYVYGIKAFSFTARIGVKGITFSKNDRGERKLSFGDLVKAFSFPQIKGIVLKKTSFYVSTADLKTATLSQGAFQMVSGALKVIEPVCRSELAVEYVGGLSNGEGVKEPYKTKAYAKIEIFFNLVAVISFLIKICVKRIKYAAKQ